LNETFYAISCDILKYMKNEKIIIKDIVAMSRGRVVVDENLEFIINELRKRNIIVITLIKRMKDNDIKSHILSGRIFITNNSADFVKDATSYEYGIIATENIRFKDPEKLAKMISDAIIEFELWSIINSNGCFILHLKNDGKHVLKMLKN